MVTNSLTNYTQSAAGDGYPNLLKYATGSSPTNADNLARMGCGVSNGIFELRFNRNATAVIVERRDERDRIRRGQSRGRQSPRDTPRGDKSFHAFARHRSIEAP